MMLLYIKGHQVKYILAMDQGTTSSRAMLFDEDLQLLCSSQEEFKQHFPEDGWVEHDPEDLWRSSLDTCRRVVEQISPKDIIAIGISNQRETTLIWDRETGEAIYPAIVWQDRRTAHPCQQMRNEGYGNLVIKRTGLLLDPYFSATKIAWILDNVIGARKRALNGGLAFGTVDTYIIWRLTMGKRHVTDATNASRTLLFNIHSQQWDEELLALFDIPKELLPDVLDSADDFGLAHASHLGHAIPIRGVAGDQQSALIGQACFTKGLLKTTYGTGCFMMMNTGEQAVASQHRLISTVAYRLKGQVTYAQEGSIFVAGAAVQWLRDALQLINNAGETESLAQQVPDNGGVYLVPAFTGMGAPYWDPKARGAILGLTRDSGIAHIVRAALEAVCYQTYDLLQAMEKDSGIMPQAMRIDGGMVVNGWFNQFLADLLNIPIERPVVHETSALGAALLAGVQAGIYDFATFATQQWQLQEAYKPNMTQASRRKLYEGWRQAVSATLSSDFSSERAN